MKEFGRGNCRGRGGLQEISTAQKGAVCGVKERSFQVRRLETGALLGNREKSHLDAS